MGRFHRRSSDHDRYGTFVQRVMLAGTSIAILYGQAEMLGEPWRHLITVAGLAVLIAVAIWMKQT